MEGHRIHRISWLRAAVLGANDGIISNASLLIGVAAANISLRNIFITGIAGLIAGTISMAAGEYISVSSQADTEKAELQREKIELETNLTWETEELTVIYVKRGLDYPLARQVAEQLMAHDALGAHSRDELGITDTQSARPFLAAFSSACSFFSGALIPVLIASIAPPGYLIESVSIAAVLLLILLGSLAAKVGGSRAIVSIIRITLWGSFALLLSVSIGSILGTTV